MKKILAMVLALAMVLSVAAAMAEYKTVEAGKFIYSTSPDFPPFESKDDNENVIGIEPDILAIICQNLGLEPVAYEIDFDSALMAPSAGKADAVVSGVTVREDRKATMEFTIPYVTIVQGFQALQNGQIDCIMVDDMVGAAYVKQIPGLEMIQTAYEPEEFAFGFAKDNLELVEVFNTELQKLIDDGTIESIILKWNE